MSAELIWRLRVFDWRVVFQHDRDFRRQRRSAALQSNKIFWQCRSTALQNSSPFATRYSPFAIRHSPLFRQEPRPPFVPVPRPTTLVPLKVGTQYLRHQLRVKTRSMKFHVLLINYGLKSEA